MLLSRFKLASPLLLAALLAGCALLPEPVPTVVTTSLRDGAVTIDAPPGYCIDPTATNTAEGFALMAPCATVTGTGPLPVASGVITVQVSRPETALVNGSETALQALLESPDGAALLSPDGDASRIAVLSVAATGNNVRVAFEDSGTPEIAGTAGTVRRAFVDIGDRLVTMSLRGLASVGLPQAAARDLLIDLVEATKLANRQET